jgi:P-type Cu+ transporter
VHGGVHCQYLEPRRQSSHAVGTKRRDLHLPDASRNPPGRAGACPICGMALEPETCTAEAQPNLELADISLRFSIGLLLALPVFALEMGGHLVGLH